MSKSHRVQTKVQEGGRVEVVVPDIPVGRLVDITIQPADEGPNQRQSVIDILAECPGGVLFKTAEEVDEYIRQERASWDR